MLELSIALVIYDWVSAMGLLKTILTKNFNENNLATQDSTTERIVANWSVERFLCCALFMSVQASLCEVLWDGSHPRTCRISRLRCICSIYVLEKKLSFSENTFISDFQHLFFEGNAWSLSLSSPNLAAVWSCCNGTLVMATYSRSLSSAPSIHRTRHQPDSYIVSDSSY